MLPLITLGKNLKRTQAWEFRKLCPTRWTVRGNSVESIIRNYNNLKQLWDECLEKRLDPDIKGRIIGVKTQMTQYKVLFGLKLCERVLKITDN